MPTPGCKFNEFSSHPLRLRTGVYCIRNKINNKRYVGSTINSFRYRLSIHRCELNKGIHCNKHLQSSWNKYGEDSFEIVILRLCAPEDCTKIEQEFIDLFKVNNSKYGYNKRLSASSSLGTVLGPMSAEHKANISKALKGKLKGRILSAEHRAKISVAKKGCYVSLETRQKISIAHTGVLKGPLSAEAREKISQSKRGKSRKVKVF